MRELIDVALGKQKAQMVLKRAKIANIFTDEVVSADIAIEKGRIAGIGDYKGFHELDCSKYFALPGFIEPHIHLESSFLIPQKFAWLTVPRGTTTVVCDPHEMGNIYGYPGIKFLLDDAQNSPQRVFFMAPSCVPCSQMGTSGGVLSSSSVKKLLQNPLCLGLGEMMNYPGLFAKDREVLSKIDAASRKIRDGHAPLVSGKELNAYVGQEIYSDHECTQEKEALEKMRLGMKIMVRNGSGEKNLKDLAKVAKKHSRNCMLVSDDISASDLFSNGHIDQLLRLAVKSGISPFDAIRMVTLNPAEYFGFKDLGAIAPGKVADIVMVNDLKNFEVTRVIIRGKMAAFNGKPLFLPKAIPRLASSMHVKPVSADQLNPKFSGTANVIQVRGDQILTKWLKERVPSKSVNHAAVIERHGKSQKIGLGFVKGFDLSEGALASTVAHDDHNLAVVGADFDSMALAANELIACGGGLCAVGKQKTVVLKLPYGGLMSDDIEGTIAGLKMADEHAKRLGCRLPKPFSTLSFVSLAVIPEIRLTDKGLVDVGKMRFVDLRA